MHSSDTWPAHPRILASYSGSDISLHREQSLFPAVPPEASDDEVHKSVEELLAHMHSYVGNIRPGVVVCNGMSGGR